jgi:hypothetical protein
VIDVGRSFIEYIGKRDEGSVEITWPKSFKEFEDITIDVYLHKVTF